MPPLWASLFSPHFCLCALSVVLTRRSLMQASNPILALDAQLIEQADASDFQWDAFLSGFPDVTLFPKKVWSRL
ncbi:MAG: hypothetical protein H7240_08535 [Glaciimonas sp.]|nr:hypothetical protein [Glaciimonas sp.]